MVSVLPPLHDVARGEIETHRARDREAVEPRVLLESLVLEHDQRTAKFLRHLLARRKAPLPVVCDARREQRAVTRLDHIGQR